MRNKFFYLIIALLLGSMAWGQKYSITFVSDYMVDSAYFLGQHFRDSFVVRDSARAKGGKICFSGKEGMERGVYTLLNAKKKPLFDFMIDDSRNFTIFFDSLCTNAGMRVAHSEANRVMFEYMANLEGARKMAKQWEELQKSDSPAIRDSAKTELDKLSDRMNAYEDDYFEKYAHFRFTQLVNMAKYIDVPDEKELSVPAFEYFRNHYWDNVDLSDHSLIYTPQLFDKMNYYFFGILYHLSSDTISQCANRLLHKVEKDSTMLRYVLDFITPRYERSTKMIGWDQVFVNLVKDYYLAGKCPWASDAEIYSKRKTIEFLSHSLIGSLGAELWMADTNQSPNPNQWISSHRFPQRFVMLWFWDPDCNHCQQQTEELKIIYDSMQASGNKYFEVYAIGYEADVEKWKRYVREHQLPFVNVGGPNVNVDYQEMYNVHGAPTMILLNENREIIMNKTLPMQEVIPFLHKYEREHPLK